MGILMIVIGWLLADKGFRAMHTRHIFYSGDGLFFPSYKPPVSGGQMAAAGVFLILNGAWVSIWGGKNSENS